MKLRWSSRARLDVAGFYEFLAPKSRRAAARVVDVLNAAPKRLMLHPRLGERLEKFSPQEIRRLVVQDYELRYEVLSDEIYVLRIWHAREDR